MQVRGSTSKWPSSGCASRHSWATTQMTPVSFFSVSGIGSLLLGLGETPSGLHKIR
jgi:hypothetical protein